MNAPSAKRAGIADLIRARMAPSLATPMTAVPALVRVAMAHAATSAHLEGLALMVALMVALIADLMADPH